MLKKCTPLWREAHLEVKSVKNWRGSEQFWKLRCWKSARRCGAKRISKSKCTKHLGPLLEVEMSKKWTPLWREAHFEVKMHKAHHVRTTFGDSDVVSRKGLWTLSKVSKTWAFVAFSTTTTATPHYIPIHYTTLQLHLHYILLHYTPLHSTTLHCTQLHSITLRYTTLHYTTLHYTTLRYTTLQYTTLHYIRVRYTTFHYTTLHYTTLHYTTFHNTTTTTTQNYITPHYITLNDTAPQIDR